MLDDLRAPMSAAAFQRFADKYRLTPGGVRLYGLVASIVAAAFLIGAFLMLGFAAECYFLKSYGTPANATASEISTRVETGRHNVKTKWEKIQYSFKTDDGKILHSVIDQPATELAGIIPTKFPVVYWPRFPSVNIPLDFQPSNHAIFLVSFLLLAFAPYFVLFSRRAFFFASNGGLDDEAAVRTPLRL